MKTRRKTGTGRKQKAASAKNALVSALASDCTIAQTGTIKKQLAKVVDRSQTVTLDLSAVRRIDTAGFQLLVSFIRERRAAGRNVQCERASEAFSVTAGLLGLSALFGPVTQDPVANPAAGAA